MRRSVFIPLLIAFSLMSAVALAADYPITIVEIKTKDIDGNPETGFSRGEVVVIETKLGVNPESYPAEATSYLEIIQVVHNKSVMKLLMTNDAISTGEEKIFSGGFRIESNDPTGTYSIEVYVWNGLPSEMGAAWEPLTQKATSSFTVNP